MTTSKETQLLKVASFLRGSPIVKVQECIMAEKRVDAFKGVSATKALLSSGYRKLRGVPAVTTAEEATSLLQDMMNAGLFLKAKPSNNSRFLQPDMSRVWSDEALYAWIFEGSQWTTIILGIVLFSLVFSFMLFPLWPYGIRSKASIVLNYGMYLAIGIMVFLIGISIIRMIVYFVTYFTCKPGIWIFPRLWDENAGVLESFVPLWDWDQPASKENHHPPSSTNANIVATDKDTKKE